MPAVDQSPTEFCGTKMQRVVCVSLDGTIEWTDRTVERELARVERVFAGHESALWTVEGERGGGEGAGRGIASLIGTIERVSGELD